MSLATLLVQVAAESEEHGNVALETVGFGITALVVFAALALVTLSYRNVANRHAGKATAYASAHRGARHGAGPLGRLHDRCYATAADRGDGRHLRPHPPRTPRRRE